MTTSSELEPVRRAFAKQTVASADVVDQSSEDAFTTVQREDFLPPGRLSCAVEDVYVTARSLRLTKRRDIGRWARPACRAAMHIASWSIALIVLAGLPLPANGASASRNVLVLNAFTQLLPANIALDRGLRGALAESAERRVELFTEYLDVPRFTGTSYARTVATFLHDKYVLHPPDVVVVAGNSALEFVLANRALIFPHTPIVHMAMPATSLRAFPALPSDVVGVPVEYDSRRSIETAARLRPSASHLVLVTGASQWDRTWEARLRSEAASFPPGLKPEFLAGLPTDAVHKRLAELGKDAVVFTPGYFEDANGRTYTPRESVQLMAAAAAAPVFGPYDSFIGTGVVGGYMPSYEAMGRDAGHTVNALLDGAAPESLRLPTTATVIFNADWRQVRRWGLDETAIPHDAVVLFREPSVWARYGWQIIAIAIALVLQSLLIVNLLIQHRRRRIAEMESRKRLSEMAHMSRSVALGELSASIAHEINQPLGAILNNANAAEILLKASPPALTDVADILGDIKRDDVRAGEVITRIRGLLRKTEFQLRDADLNATIEEALKFLVAEAAVKSVALRTELAAGLPPVRADQVQIEQVILNLALNAMDAMHDVHVSNRKITIRTAKANEAEAEVSVTDSGPGVPADILPRIFESFFTTKLQGMGLGLAISRTIVEAHRGRLWAETAPVGGAVVRFTLPFATPNSA